MTSRRQFLEIGAAGFLATKLGAVKRREDRMVKAVVFDVFGTCVDWRSSIAGEINALANRKGVTVDGARFADAWRMQYGPTMNRVRTGELPWTKLDQLHRMTLDRLVVEFGLKGLTETEIADLNRAWHRLRPWPDVVPGLTRLKKDFVIAPLSNGNISLITNMARNAGLPWDCVLGAELVRHYKPDPEVYRSAYELLDLEPSQVLMVACHLSDLKGAAATGLKTAFVPRPAEYGPAGKPDTQTEQWVDVSADDFEKLATLLGA